MLGSHGFLRKKRLKFVVAGSESGVFGVIRALTYQFYGDFLIGSNVGAMIDVSERAAAQFARKSVFSSDS